MTGELLTEVFVPGKSLTKGSWTFVTSKYAKAPEGRKEWARQVAAAVSVERRRRLGAVGARPARAAAAVTLTFFLPIGLRDPKDEVPIGHQTGDIDKLTRLILDALKDGGCYTDDSVVVKLDVGKLWAFGVIPQGVHIKVTEATEDDAGRVAAAMAQIARQGLDEETGY